MDIKYLLMLQELRNATGGIFDEFFNAITKVAVDIMVFLPFLIFWGYDKKWGYRFLATDWFVEAINGVIKLTVCAYRPWIRSAEIEPAGDSKVAATGYSFPSGHTTKATAMYGTVALWQYKSRRWLSVLCVIMILVTGFSRNFLGVHTPQDVVFAIVFTTIFIFVVGKIQNYLDTKDDKFKDMMTWVGIGLAVLAIIYIHVKPYPMDYVDGVLLVDPKKMMKDCMFGCGGAIGFCVGSYIDRHYTHYVIPVASPNLALLTGVGMGIIFSWKKFFEPATVVLAFGANIGNLISAFLMVIFGIVIWPMVIKKYTEK